MNCRARFEPSATCCSSLLASCAAVGQWQPALMVIQQLEQAGRIPDEEMYCFSVKACEKAGMHAHAASMVERGVQQQARRAVAQAAALAAAKAAELAESEARASEAAEAAAGATAVAEMDAGGVLALATAPNAPASSLAADIGESGLAWASLFDSPPSLLSCVSEDLDPLGKFAVDGDSSDPWNLYGRGKQLSGFGGGGVQCALNSDWRLTADEAAAATTHSPIHDWRASIEPLPRGGELSSTSSNMGKMGRVGDASGSLLGMPADPVLGAALPPSLASSFSSCDSPAGAQGLVLPLNASWDVPGVIPPRPPSPAHQKSLRSSTVESITAAVVPDHVSSEFPESSSPSGAACEPDFFGKDMALPDVGSSDVELNEYLASLVLGGDGDNDTRDALGRAKLGF